MYCSSCHTPNPAYNDYCSKCGLALDGSGRQQQARVIETVEVDPTLPSGASFGIRFLARIIDLIPYFLASIFATNLCALYLWFHATNLNVPFSEIWARNECF